MDAKTLTASEIEQLGRVLAPLIRESMRPELDKLRADLAAIINGQKADADRRFETVEGRITALERLAYKAAGALVAINAIIEFLRFALHR